MSEGPYRVVGRTEPGGGDAAALAPMTLREQAREAVKLSHGITWTETQAAVESRTLDAIGPLLDKAEAKIALRKDELAQAILAHADALKDRDRALAEAALLREALNEAADMWPRPNKYDALLDSAPLAAAAARVIAAAMEWETDSGQHPTGLNSDDDLRLAIRALRALRDKP